MFFESLLPTFNLNNRGGEQQQQQQQQNAVLEAVAEHANALPAPQANLGHDDDEVAQVDRHLQALNANLENAAGECVLIVKTVNLNLSSNAK